MTPNKFRDELVKELRDWQEFDDCQLQMLSDFIIKDRIRIVDPIFRFKNFIVHAMGTISWSDKDGLHNAINETLKNAGIEE